MRLNNGIELGPAADIFIHKKSLRDGRGIGEASRFHDDTIHAAPAPHQAAQNSYEIATHRTADAAVVHFENFFFRVDDEIIVNSNLTEFIDNDGITLAVRLRKNPVEQRGLSRTEITGDYRDGSLVRSRLHGIVLSLMLKLYGRPTSMRRRSMVISASMEARADRFVRPIAQALRKGLSE